MRKLNGFILFCAFVVAGSTANADVIIDNQAIPSADISSISLSPSTGHLYVSTIPGYTLTRVGATSSNVTINSLTISPSSINTGGTATVSWDVSNGVTCTPGGGVGGWGSVAISLPTGSTTITTTRLGTKTFTLTCYGVQAGDSAFKSADLTITDPAAPPPPPTVAITSFLSSKSSMEEGEITTMSWATTNATSCTPSGGAGGWNTQSIGLPNGSVNIAIPTAGTYTFALTCKDAAANSVLKTANVTVNPPPTACQTPPLGGSTIQWGTFWGVNFPNPGYDMKPITVGRTGYVAIQFNTGNIVSSGKLTSVETTVSTGVRLGAISECPGDFNVTDACDYTWGIGGGLSWATDGGAGCQLQPNTTYYFNLTYTDGFDAASTSCTTSTCTSNLQHSIQ